MHEPQVATEFESGYDKAGILRGRYGIALRDLGGTLIGFVGIALSSEQSPRLKFPESIEPATALFNAHRIDDDDDLLICRSPLEAILAVENGAPIDSGLGRGNDRRLRLTETHEQPRLAIGDVATGQGAVPHRHEEPASYPVDHDRQQTRPFQGRVVRRIRNVSRATPSCRHASGDTFSSRLTRAPHPDCRAPQLGEVP